MTLGFGRPRRGLGKAEQALPGGGQTGLARRAAALDRAQDAADARERAADERNRTARDSE